MDNPWDARPDDKTPEAPVSGESVADLEARLAEAREAEAQAKQENEREELTLESLHDRILVLERIQSGGAPE